MAGPPLTVLVIDDEPPIRRFLRHLVMHENSGDPDILNAKFVLETQGPDELVNYIFKEDPQAMGMVDSLYEDTDPEDSPDPHATQERRKTYERNLKDWDPDLAAGRPRNPATRNNWNYLQGR